MRFSVKHKISVALATLILLAVICQASFWRSLALGNTTGKTVPPAAARSPARHTPGVNPTAITQDFQEALAVIRQNYIDGNKLDYNDVYKSSIFGMLRSLDPHSNYFDRQEFEDMLSDQRSEYYGIGASILNYAIGNSVDTYISATFQELAGVPRGTALW